MPPSTRLNTICLLLLFFTLTSSFLCNLAVSSGNNNGLVTIPSTGQLSYSNMSYSGFLLRADNKDGFDSNDQITNATLIAKSLDMYATWFWSWQGETVKQIHEISPQVKCLLYRDMRIIYNYSDEWQTAVEKGWLLKDSSGNFIHSNVWVQNYLADIGNPEYQNFVAQWLNYYFNLYGFDGVCADESFTVWKSEYMWDVDSQPINPRTGLYYTEDELITDLKSLINHVKDGIGTKLFISNGINNGERFFAAYDRYVQLLAESRIDGFYSEGLFNDGQSKVQYSEEKWKQSVDFVAWIQENWLNGTSKIFCPYSICKSEWGFGLPENCTQKQMATFVFTSLLLSVNKSRNYLLLHGAMLLNEIQSLFKLDFGVPRGGYYRVENSHVYARDFSKTKVLVNPTDQPFRVDLGINYETLEGQIVSSINVDPHTGLILKVVST